MRKCVFIVEDQLKDLDGFFISLNDLLLDAPVVGGGSLGSEDLKLFFLHICWKMDAPGEGKALFDEKIDEVRKQVKKMIDRDAFDAEYCAIQQGSDRYTSADGREYSQQILLKIQELLSNELGHDVEIPNAGEPCYVVLMDVILNNAPEKDLALIEKGDKIPSSWLYEQLTANWCIVYSEYPSAPICAKWKEITGMHEDIIEREFIARSRAACVPLERKMYQILGLEPDLE